MRVTAALFALTAVTYAGCSHPEPRVASSKAPTVSVSRAEGGEERPRSAAADNQGAAGRGRAQELQLRCRLLPATSSTTVTMPTGPRSITVSARPRWRASDDALLHRPLRGGARRDPAERRRARRGLRFEALGRQNGWRVRACPRCAASGERAQGVTPQGYPCRRCRRSSRALYRSGQTSLQGAGRVEARRAWARRRATYPYGTHRNEPRAAATIMVASPMIAPSSGLPWRKPARLGGWTPSMNDPRSIG